MAVGPDYEQPDLFPKQGWLAPLEKGLAKASPDMGQLSRWWTVLNDPVLTDLIRNAVGKQSRCPPGPGTNPPVPAAQRH